jgi:hypothetical protein
MKVAIITLIASKLIKTKLIWIRIFDETLIFLRPISLRAIILMTKVPMCPYSYRIKIG